MRKILFVTVAVSGMVCLLFSHILRSQVTQKHTESTTIQILSVQDDIKHKKTGISPRERQRMILQVAKQLVKQPEQIRKTSVIGGENNMIHFFTDNFSRLHQKSRYSTIQKRQNRMEKLKDNSTYSEKDGNAMLYNLMKTKHNDQNLNAPTQTRNSVQLRNIVKIRSSVQTKNIAQTQPLTMQYRSVKNGNRTFASLIKNFNQENRRIQQSSFLIRPTKSLTKFHTSSEPHDTFEFLIKNENICVGMTGERVVLLVGVYVGVNEKALRKYVRRTWGSKVKVGSKMRLVFLIGKSENDLEMSRIRKENNVYRDIIQADFMDTYRNLTLKSIAFFHWIGMYCQNAKYILKIDSDMKIDLGQLMAVLQTRKIPDKFICGYILPKAIVVRERDNKWYVSYQTYPSEYYPTYCHGAAYLTTQRIGREIAKLSVPAVPFPIDDAYITGIVREVLGESIERGIITFDHHYEPTQTKVMEGDFMKYIMTVHVDGIEDNQQLELKHHVS